MTEVQQEEIQPEEVQQDVQMSHNVEEEVGGQEQEVNQENENVRASQENLPEPPLNDLVVVMASQTRLMEALAQGPQNNRGGGPGY